MALGKSHVTFDNYILSMIRTIQPNTIVDLGCGLGKVGELVKVSSLRSKLPSGFTLTGVNPLFNKEEDRDLLLSKGYDNILDLSIKDYCEEYIDQQIDLFTALDVLEHLPRSDVFSILDMLLYRSKFVLIIWPSRHPQLAEGDPYKAHRSSFVLRDLATSFEVVSYLTTGFAPISSVHNYSLCLLRGHMFLSQMPPII